MLQQISHKFRRRRRYDLECRRVNQPSSGDWSVTPLRLLGAGVNMGSSSINPLLEIGKHGGLLEVVTL